MIDSHCHLDHEPLFKNISEVIARSKKIGINKLLTICTTIKSFENIIKLIDLDKIIYGTFGIHPHESEKDIINKEEIINNTEKHKKIIGIGETGLDFFYNHSNHDKQISSFKVHIEASIETNLPLIVHSRDAEEETYKILESYKNHNLKILMHCFTGSKEFSDKLLNLNTFFSASGIITFKNSNELQETFKDIPNEKLLVETDSPFLAPIPMRGKKNEPSYLIYTLKKLAEIKSLSNEEMINITTNNFNSLFSN
tara:strand:+ start:954 stop:1715 length:762 start_codon:yes stop_codon:yes gene_type:complete